MISQRERETTVVRARAEYLPFRNSTFDAAMALWTIHHWTDPAKGVAELRRVAGSVIVVAGSVVLNDLWLTKDYFPAMSRARRPEIQPELIARQLGPSSRIEVLPIPRDCLDGFGEAFWARPEEYLEGAVREGTSAFRLLSTDERKTGLAMLRADLQSGKWDRQYGWLRTLDE